MNLTILCGISNSGKSTWAHSQWLQNPLNTVIVSRDKIREMLYGFTEATIEYYYHLDNFEKLEAIVAGYEKRLVQLALTDGKNVIIDDTHLKYSFTNNFKQYSGNIEIKYFDISLEEALKRNSKRSRKVLESVIEDQYVRYQKIKEER